MEDTPRHRADRVKDWARNLGFDACGIASTAVPIDPTGRLHDWLTRGFQADMAWMAKTAEVRADVHKKLPGTRSVVVVARNYFGERPEPSQRSGRVARYAWGRDYHKVLKKPLIELARRLDGIEPAARSYASIDTGPVLERAWAQRAGVASVGKNSLGLRRDLGSWFFLGTVLTTLELAPDEPAEDLCGTCTLCIEACPTGAIVEPRVVDSNRCISYHTIENRGDIPQSLHAAHGDWVFGCDDCQDVCPWNRFATPTNETAFRARPSQANPSLSSLLRMNVEAFDERFAGTAIRRAKYAGMRRNAAIAFRNLEREERHSTPAEFDS